jgi:enoyl-CoA hydratase/carnithine racemase
MLSAPTQKLAVDLRTASGSSRIMTDRDEIDALLTRIGVIMEDGTKCLLSRTLDESELAALVTATSERIDQMKLLIAGLSSQIT